MKFCSVDTPSFNVRLLLGAVLAPWCPLSTLLRCAAALKRLNSKLLAAGPSIGLLAAVSRPGLTISAKFRRNFGKFFVSASYRDSKFRYFSVYFVFKFKIQQISTEIQRNSPKFTEISERNSVSAKHRDLTGKRNG